MYLESKYRKVIDMPQHFLKAGGFRADMTEFPKNGVFWHFHEVSNTLGYIGERRELVNSF